MEVNCNLDPCKQMLKFISWKNEPERKRKIPKISPEVDPTWRICAGCAERVDAQHAFRTRALHCNSYIENGLEDKEDENMCRFCLKIPGGGGSVADEVQTVRDCLGVEIISWDTVTKICGDCVSGVGWISGGIFADGRAGEAGGLDGFVGFVQDSSTADNGEKRKVTARSQPWIGSDHEDRNFDVLDETYEAIEVVFEEYPFDLRLVLSDGSSLWHCVQCKLRGCVKLKIDAKGMLATSGGSIDKNNHMNEMDKLMEFPEGKGMVHAATRHSGWFAGGNSYVSADDVASCD
ncbi:hypothetical protein quinque_009327 [Culex quinquefasciatus]